MTGAKVNVKMKHTKETPLHITSRLGYLEMTRMLIEYGADLEARNVEDKKASQVFKVDSQWGQDMASLFRFYEGKYHWISDGIAFNFVCNILVMLYHRPHVTGENVKSTPKSSKLTKIALSCPKIMKAA